jgi:hypothetical protein
MNLPTVIGLYLFTQVSSDRHLLVLFGSVIIFGFLGCHVVLVLVPDGPFLVVGVHPNNSHLYHTRSQGPTDGTISLVLMDSDIVVWNFFLQAELCFICSRNKYL